MMVKLFWCKHGAHDWCTGVSERTAKGKKIVLRTLEEEKVRCDCECGHDTPLPREEVHEAGTAENVDVSLTLAESAAETTARDLEDVPAGSGNR